MLSLTKGKEVSISCNNVIPHCLPTTPCHTSTLFILRVMATILTMVAEATWTGRKLCCAWCAVLGNVQKSSPLRGSRDMTRLVNCITPTLCSPDIQELNSNYPLSDPNPLIATVKMSDNETINIEETIDDWCDYSDASQGGGGEWRSEWEQIMS